MRSDSVNEARAKGLMEFRKVTYKSRVDGLEIPAYLFAPLTKNPAKHAALVWVHGGVHSNWGTGMATSAGATAGGRRARAPRPR